MNMDRWLLIRDPGARRRKKKKRRKKEKSGFDMVEGMKNLEVKREREEN